VLFDAEPLPLEVAAAAVVAHTLAAERALEGPDPWSRRDGWRLHGSALRRFDIEAHGSHHVFALERAHAGSQGAAQTLVLGSQRWPFAVVARGEGRHDLTLGSHRWSLTVYATGEQFNIFVAEGSAVVRAVDPIAHAADGGAHEGRLSAPMPGKVVALLAAVGQAVSKGQALAVMEAMKMEHTIVAPRDGIIEEWLYAVGDAVSEGGELLRLAAAAATPSPGAP